MDYVCACCSLLVPCTLTREYTDFIDRPCLSAKASCLDCDRQLASIRFVNLQQSRRPPQQASWLASPIANPRDTCCFSGCSFSGIELWAHNLLRFGVCECRRIQAIVKSPCVASAVSTQADDGWDAATVNRCQDKDLRTVAPQSEVPTALTDL